MSSHFDNAGGQPACDNEGLWLWILLSLGRRLKIVGSGLRLEYAQINANHHGAIGVEASALRIIAMTSLVVSVILAFALSPYRFDQPGGSGGAFPASSAGDNIPAWKG